MPKLLSAIPLFLMSCWALAANLDEAAGAPPAEPVSMVYVVLFLVLFFGMIGGFFAYIWWNEKNKKLGR